MHEAVANGPLTNWLAIIGVISLMYWAWRIAAMFKARGSNDNAGEHATNAPAPFTGAQLSAPAPETNDIAVIAAAVYAVLGAHRIVHLEAIPAEQTWAVEGRWMNQTSHNPH